MENQLIEWIAGFEPERAGEYPVCHHVGQGGVTRIERRHENMGQYGIDWFDIYAGDERIRSMQARAVAEISYLRSAGQ